jgi:hypothetical protein
MKTFFNILSGIIAFGCFVLMLHTDDVGEKIENSTIVIICFLDLLGYRISDKIKDNV